MSTLYLSTKPFLIQIKCQWLRSTIEMVVDSEKGLPKIKVSLDLCSLFNPVKTLSEFVGISPVDVHCVCLSAGVVALSASPAIMHLQTHEGSRMIGWS
jgi:hypothetical protein